MYSLDTSRFGNTDREWLNLYNTLLPARKLAILARAEYNTQCELVHASKPARVVKLVDTRDLKSLGVILRAGSSPAPGTTFVTTNRMK